MRTDLGATSLGSDFFTLSTSSTSYIQITSTGSINLLNASNFRTAIGAGTGTVTSVDLSMPSIFSVSNNPVTTSGTLTVSLANQTANTVFAGPSTGSSAAPTFRTLTFADVTDTLTVGKGGTGTSSLTSNSVLVGNGTSAVTLTSTSTQYKVFVSGSGGAPTWGSVSLDQAAAISGKLPLEHGGTNATTAAEALTNLGALSSSTSSTQDGYFGNIYLQDDTSPSNYLQITNFDNLTASRTLKINCNDADKSLTISADSTISGTNTGDQTITLTGDVTGSGTSSFAATLATSGVTSGTYNNSTTAVTPFTVDSKGRITSTSTNVTITPAFSSLTDKPTTLSGYGITDALSNSTSSTQSGYFGELYLYDTVNPSNYLKILNVADLTATRTLSINTGNSNRTLTLNGDSTISGTNTGDQTITLTGDVTGTGTSSFAATLATSGVTAGTYNNSTTAITPFTVDAKGRITSTGVASTISPAFSSITSKPTTLSGYGITDALSNSTSSTQNAYFGNIHLQDDTTPSHYLQITDAENLTADRTLNLNVNDANRTISLSGNLTVSTSATISGTNTGDQTITLTGDVTGTGTSSFSATIGSQAVTFAKIVNSGTTGLSVVGRSANSAGSFDEISAASDGQILRRSGNAIAFGNINLSSSNAVGTTILNVNNGGIGTSTASANNVFAGPTTGSATTPAFRALVAADIPNLDANKITTGTIATARLASGTAASTSYLRGDQTWATIPSASAAGGSGSLQYNDAGSFGGAAYARWNSTNNSLWLYATPELSASSAVLKLGAGFTDEVPALGDFAGSANGTILASNIGTSFTGNQVDFQVAGSNIFKIDKSGNTTIAATTASTSSTTGALIVSGGAGIAQSLYVGSNLYQNSNAITAYDTGFRNRIINGDFFIDQRNNAASITPSTTQNVIDRWKMNLFGSGRVTCGKNYGGVASPSPVTSYYGMKVTTTTTPGASDYNFFSQVIEGPNTIDLQWGTANAQSITLSFWAYSSLTGTFGGSVRNQGTFNRSYPFTYTISSANTWEKKTVVIPGDTSGTWTTSTGFGIELIFIIANGTTYQSTANSWASGNFHGPSGSLVNLIGTLNSTLYLTAVQVEIGSVSTVFERRNYGHEFALCQRYYQIVEVRVGGYNTTGNFLRGSAYLNTVMRPIVSPVFTVLETNESSNLGTLSADDSNFRGDSFRYLVQVSATGDAYGQWKVSCDTEF
jgi:cytoskeletal protein CcmA (bactofilin family)